MWVTGCVCVPGCVQKVAELENVVRCKLMAQYVLARMGLKDGQLVFEKHSGKEACARD
jgi:hypothetical protein